jgi:TonB family protein
MNRLRSAVVLVGLLATAGATQAQDFKQRFVGKSPCAHDLQSEHVDFSLRLDKTQNTTLLYRNLSETKILMIVQPTADKDCGMVRDLIQITRIAKDLEFRCFDPQAPTDVVIGTSIRKYGNIKDVTAIDAWRIDLKEQKFIETNHKVVCSADGFSGEDDGSDMVDEAKKYAAHHKPGQFASEQPILPKGTPVTPLTQVTWEGKVIESVQPKYPEEPLKNRLTGTVVLHVILQKDGTVRQVDVVSGQPVFAEAAVDAVKQWKNQPTVLNGEPVEVDTLVYVKFMLRPALSEEGQSKSTHPAVVSLPRAPISQIPSPNGKWTLIFECPNNCSERKLWLEETSSHARKLVKEYERSLDISWAPDSRLFFVNDNSGSTDARCYVYEPAPLKETDLAKVVLAGDPGAEQFLDSGHSYLRAKRWLNSHELLVVLTGHNDGSPPGAFTLRYRIDLRGTVHKLSQRPEEEP